MEKERRKTKEKREEKTEKIGLYKIYRKIIFESMTKAENRQRIKNEALNRIVKIYDPRSQNHYSNFEEEGTPGEQRDYWVQRIIQNMEYQLEQLNKKGINM